MNTKWNPKHITKTSAGLSLCLLIITLRYALSGSSRDAQAFQLPVFRSPLSTPQPPLRAEVTLRDVTGETTKWLRFTDAGFTLRYPPDWQVRVLPSQIAGTRIIEFAHSTPDGWVDAAIQVWETWLSSSEHLEQDPELVFWRTHAEEGRYIEPVLVGGRPGWRVRTSQPIVAGTLVQTVLVEREGRLYRFRLYLYQDTVVEPYVRVLGLMMGALRTRKSTGAPISPMPSEPAEVLQPLSAGHASMRVNYNRGAAYAYTRTWWNKQNNDDGCYLWYNGRVLDSSQMCSFPL